MLLLGAWAWLNEPNSACAFEPSAPDYLEAAGAELSEDGVVTASGGVTLYIGSLIEGSTLVVTADEVVYDTDTGVAEMSGSIVIELEVYGLRLTCDYFHYDPFMQRMHVAGVRVDFPIEALLGSAQLSRESVYAGFGSHFYGGMPERIFLAAGEANFDYSSEGGEFVITDARLTHHPSSDPDLYLIVGEIRLGSNDRVELKDVSLVISGVTVFSWAKVERGLLPSARFYSFQPPILSIDRHVGAGWIQGARLNFGALTTDVLVDYSLEKGFLTHGFTYVAPLPGAKLGIEYGRRTDRDVDRTKVERHDEYNFVYRQELGGRGGWFQNLKLDAEYGHLAAFDQEVLAGGIMPGRRETDRVHAAVDLELTPLLLGGEWYLAYGGIMQYTDYRDYSKNYRVVGGRIGIIRREGSFNHFVLYRANSIEGEPVFSFDQVRERELNFATTFKLHPQWRQIVRGIYDLETEEFDMLQLGVLKRQRTYEVGAFWDFARRGAGLEFGLLFD